MRFVKSIFMLCLLCGMTVGSVDTSWSWGKKPLVVIDGKEYFVDDYKQWWRFWRDSADQKPESVQPFVEWLLMAREGERMDLASLPEFKHKVEVFLSARTLMLLKQEEIDSKIQLTDDDLKSVYDRDYVPGLLVGVLEFPTMEESKKFHDQFVGQGMDQQRLQLMADKQPAPPFVFHPSQWLRPINTPAPWLPVLDKATGGTLHGPLPFGEKAAILFVAEVKSGDQVDFENKKETIRYDLRKQREQELTEKLVRNLMVKYNVHLDQQVLEKINLSDPGANDQDLVVIKSDRSTVTVGYFLDQIRKETDITRKLAPDAEGQMTMKRRLANAMIANSMVSWEALSRRYEEQEPLRWAYQFYLQNRLVVELESRAPGEIKVVDSEIQDYYKAHQEEFKRPEMVRGVMVTGEKVVIRKVWAEAISGTELTKAAESNGATIAVSPAHEVPYQHFSVTAQKIIAAQKNDDMSQPFLDNGLWVVINLKERKSGAPVPFEQVAKSIKDKILADKKAKRKQALIEALTSRSTVKVNDDVWTALAKELVAQASTSLPAE